MLKIVTSEFQQRKQKTTINTSQIPRLRSA